MFSNAQNWERSRSRGLLYTLVQYEILSPTYIGVKKLAKEA